MKTYKHRLALFPAEYAARRLIRFSEMQVINLPETHWIFWRSYELIEICKFNNELSRAYTKEGDKHV